MLILLAMIAVAPFEANPYLEITDTFLWIFPHFTMIKLLGLIGLGWVTMEVMGGHLQLRLFESHQAKAFFLFVCAVLFAGLASGVVAAPLTRLLSISLFLPLVLASVRTERDLCIALKAMAIVMILILPYGYRQVLRFGGRFGVGLYESNYLALALVLLFPLGFFFARQAVRGPKRVFWAVGVAVIFLEIVLTGSRGGFLGLLTVLLLLVFRLAKHRTLALCGVMSVTLAMVFVVPTTLGQRLLTSDLDPEMGGSAGTVASNRSRLAILEAGLKMMLDNPWTGVGLGNFKEAVVLYGDVPAAKIAHNTYLQIGAELGIGALVMFLILLFVTFRSLRRSERLAMTLENRRLKELATSMQIGLVGYFVSAAFLSAQFEKFFWMIVFVSICLERVLQWQAIPSKRPEREQAWEPA